MTSIAERIAKQCKDAIAAGMVCKHCGYPITKSGPDYYHIASFMTLCGGSRDTYAEAKEGIVNDPNNYDKCMCTPKKIVSGCSIHDVDEVRFKKSPTRYKPMIERATFEIADILAYQQVKRNNPKADSDISGYYTFSHDQRTFLIENQMENAKAIVAALQKKGLHV